MLSINSIWRWNWVVCSRQLENSWLPKHEVTGRELPLSMPVVVLSHADPGSGAIDSHDFADMVSAADKGGPVH